MKQKQKPSQQEAAGASVVESDATAAPPKEEMQLQPSQDLTPDVAQADAHPTDSSIPQVKEEAPPVAPPTSQSNDDKQDEKHHSAMEIAKLREQIHKLEAERAQERKTSSRPDPEIQQLLAQRTNDLSSVQAALKESEAKAEQHRQALEHLRQQSQSKIEDLEQQLAAVWMRDMNEVSCE